MRVLGVLFTPDLALDKHMSAVSAKCFYQLRQLRRVRRSLDTESTKILVHAFVTSRIKVIENGTIPKLGYGFLFTFHSN